MFWIHIEMVIVAVSIRCVCLQTLSSSMLSFAIALKWLD